MGSENLRPGFNPDGSVAENRTIKGTDKSDKLVGGYGHDTISGLAGDDTIDGQAGSDTIYGNDGNDNLTGNLLSDLFCLFSNWFLNLCWHSFGSLLLLWCWLFNNGWFVLSF